MTELVHLDLIVKELGLDDPLANVAVDVVLPPSVVDVVAVWSSAAVVAALWEGVVAQHPDSVPDLTSADLNYFVVLLDIVIEVLVVV